MTDEAVSGEQNRTCSTCRAWRVTPSDDQLGYCHRRAPQINAATFSEDELPTWAAWPATWHDDGCEEHLPVGGLR